MTDLCRIMAKHGSDKSPLFTGNNRRSHDYTPLYDEWFSERRESIESVLEVGVWQGGSLSGWAEYFPKARIIGIDIRRPMTYTERICTYQLDQRERNEIETVLLLRNKTFEIIIDDGLHNPSGAIPFFTEAFPYLAQDGYYIVEDVKPQNVVETLARMQNAHPTANITLHDLRYEGSKYDNILIVARHV